MLLLGLAKGYICIYIFFGRFLFHYFWEPDMNENDTSLHRGGMGTAYVCSLGVLSDMTLEQGSAESMSTNTIEILKY